MAYRGQLTDEIKQRSKELLGYEISTRELRLMVHVQYVMCNDQKIDPVKINGEERDILQKWRKAGHIEGGMTGLSITREFWDIMCSIIWYGYVAYREYGVDSEKGQDVNS